MSDQQIACSECGGNFVFTAAEQTFYAEKQLAAPPKRCKTCRLARKSARDGGGGGGGGGGNRRFAGGGQDGGFRGAPRGRPATGGGGWSSPAAPAAPTGRFPGGGGGRDARPAGNFRGGNGAGTSGGSGGSFRGAAAPNREAPRDGRGDFRSPPFSSGGTGPAPGRGDTRGREPRFGDTPAPPRRAPEPQEARPARPRPERPKFDITCAECGTQAHVPFKPLEGRQVFCQPCYRARRGSMENAAEGVAVGETDSGIVE